MAEKACHACSLHSAARLNSGVRRHEQGFRKLSDLKTTLLGLLAAVFAGGIAIALAFTIAFRSFWWCYDGGCSLAAWSAKLHLLGNVMGVIALVAFFTLSFLFLFVLLIRPFVGRPTVEAMLFRVELPMLGWYDQLMHKWVRLLWRRHAA